MSSMKAFFSAIGTHVNRIVEFFSRDILDLDPEELSRTKAALVKCSRIALEYSRQKDFDIQMKTFCWDRYTHCEIYRVLIEKEEYCE